MRNCQMTTSSILNDARICTSCNVMQGSVFTNHSSCLIPSSQGLLCVGLIDCLLNLIVTNDR